MSVSVDGKEDIRVAQLQDAWNTTLSVKEYAEMLEEVIRDLHAALGVLASFVKTPLDAVMAGEWE